MRRMEFGDDNDTRSISTRAWYENLGFLYKKRTSLILALHENEHFFPKKKNVLTKFIFCQVVLGYKTR